MNWVNEITPQNIHECSNKVIINKMTNWLETWEKKGKVDSIKNAILLHGPSGTGKTLYAKLLLEEFGYNEILYFSTNDIKTYSRLTKRIDKFIKNFTFLSFTKKIKKAIIFDELEGIGNSDKGCIKKIIELLYPRTSKSKQKMSNIIKYSVPIICVTNNINDSRSNKIKKYCNLINFTLPNKLQISYILDNIYNIEGNHLIDHKLCNEISSKYKFDFNMLLRFLKQLHTYKINNNLTEIKEDDIRDFNFLKSSKDVIHSRFLNSDMYILSRQLMTTNVSYSDCYDYYNTFPSILQFIVYDNINKYYSKDNKYIDELIDNLEYASINNILDKSIHDEQNWFLNDYSSILYLKKANIMCCRNKLHIEKISFSSILNKNSKTLYTHKIVKELLDKINMNTYNLTLTGSIVTETFLKLNKDPTYIDWFREKDIIGSIDKFYKFNLFNKEYDKRVTNKYKKSILKLL